MEELHTAKGPRYRYFLKLINWDSTLKKTIFVEGHQSFITSDAPAKMKNLWKTKHSTFRNLAFKTTQTNIRIQKVYLQ